MAKNRSADEWLVFANRLLYTYVRQRLGAHPRAWGDFPAAYRHTRGFPQEYATGIACAHKAAFVRTMADFPELPPPSDTRDLWDNTMRAAERDIAAYLASNPQPGELALT